MDFSTLVDTISTLIENEDKLSKPLYEKIKLLIISAKNNGVNIDEDNELGQYAYHLITKNRGIGVDLLKYFIEAGLNKYILIYNYDEVIIAGEPYEEIISKVSIIDQAIEDGNTIVLSILNNDHIGSKKRRI